MIYQKLHPNKQLGRPIEIFTPECIQNLIDLFFKEQLSSLDISLRLGLSTTSVKKIISNHAHKHYKEYFSEELLKELDTCLVQDFCRLHPEFSHKLACTLKKYFRKYATESNVLLKRCQECGQISEMDKEHTCNVESKKFYKQLTRNSWR